MSSMESLPDKLLLSNNAPARRLVGTRSLDTTLDSVWKTLCSKDFGNIEEDKKFSKLSYRDLYESLSLWDKVEEAQVIEKVLPLGRTCAVGSFKLIGDKLLGVATNDQVFNTADQSLSDTIMYFDSETLELISQETYPFLFDQYDENEKLIVLIENRKKMHVIMKSNKCKFVYDIIKQCHFQYDILSDNEIFFVNTYSVVCAARLKVVDREETMETEKLALAEMFSKYGFVANNAIAFARVNENVVNVLVQQVRCSHKLHLLVYCCKLKNFSKCGKIYKNTQNCMSKLREFGFNWCNPYLYRLLDDKIRFLSFAVGKKREHVASVKTRDHVALVGAHCDTVYIFKRPYTDNGELDLHTASPSKTIKIENLQFKNRFIRQVDVVEMLNGHKIFARLNNGIVIFDLIHEQDRRATKRKATSGTSTTKTARKPNKL